MIYIVFLLLNRVMREFKTQHTYHLGMLDKSLENGDDSGTVYRIGFTTLSIKYIISDI